MPPARTLRRDAQRNRERIIDAASALFAERGLDAPLEEVARRAGVSIGTLYNRFPTRNDLIDAVFSIRLEAFAKAGERALEYDDPWAGLVAYLERICELQAGDRGLADLLSRQVPGAPEIARLAACGHRQAAELIERARQAGALRADFCAEDLVFITWSMARIIEATAGVSPEAWRRYLHFVLDGLRAGNALPNPVPALTPAEVHQARVNLGGGHRA